MPRGEKGRATREALLQAAFELFAEQGYKATTMREISARAGRSPGLTYRYFARKEDLGLALYRRIAEQTSSLPVAGTTPGARFASWMEGKLLAARPYRAVLGALAAAAVDPEDPLGVLSDETSEIRAEVLDQLERAVYPDGADPRLVRALYGVHLLLLLLFVQDRSEQSGPTLAAARAVGDLLDLAPPESPLTALLLARIEPVLALVR